MLAIFRLYVSPASDYHIRQNICGNLSGFKTNVKKHLLKMIFGVEKGMIYNKQ